jgi:hypothetical protein
MQYVWLRNKYFTTISITTSLGWTNKYSVLGLSIKIARYIGFS